MNAKIRHSQEYEIIDIISYVRTIKKYLPSIGAITLVTGVAAVLINIWLSGPVTYKSQATISIGTVGGNPIETREEVKDLLSSLYADIAIDEGKRANEIIISSEASSLQEIQTHLKEVIDSLSGHHRTLYETLLKRRESEIQLLKDRIKQNEELLNRYQQMIDQLSPSREAQALALQSYVTSFGTTLEKINELRSTLQNLESQDSGYIETRVKKPPSVTTIKTSNVTIALFGGIFLGLILGVFWAFIKEWWEANKRLLK